MTPSPTPLPTMTQSPPPDNVWLLYWVDRDDKGFFYWVRTPDDSFCICSGARWQDELICEAAAVEAVQALNPDNAYGSVYRLPATSIPGNLAESGTNLLSELILLNAVRLGGMDKLLDLIVEELEDTESADFQHKSQGLRRQYAARLQSLPIDPPVPKRLPLLIALARHLQDRTGQSFNGDVEVLLRYCEMI